MKSHAWVAILVSAAGGALIWALSPWLTGDKEPWDADGFYYFGALAVAGFLSGLLVPRPWWAHYVGAVIGQLLFEFIFLPIGALFFLGAIFLLAYSLIFLAAAALGSQLRLRLGSPSSNTYQ